MKVKETGETVRLDFGPLVERLEDHCLKSGDLPSLVVDAVTVGSLTPTGLREAARVGLVRSVNDRLHGVRGQIAKAAMRVERANSSPSRSGRRNYVAHNNALKISLMGTNGELKRLLDFTADDCELLRLNAKGFKVAWSDRERWAISAHALLTQFSAETVRVLPEKHVTELSQFAEEAWA